MLTDSTIYKTSGMYNCQDIQKILQCQKSKAYDVIHTLNRERKKDGLIVIAGRIPVEDFNRKFYRGYQ